MARRYHVTPLPSPGRSTLPREVAHHLGRVMRCRAGDALVLFDGSGHECDATVERVARDAIDVVAGAARAAGREPEIEVHAAFAAPKGNRAEWLFEHGTEIGIAAFHPIVTERATPPAREPARESAREERWRRILAAATGQCDRGRIPALHPLRDLDAFLADPDLPSERYLAAAGAPPLRAAAGARVLLLVGPEGGLTDAEAQAAAAAGFAPRGLGVTTLRTETAVLAGAVRLLSADPAHSG